jgi:hypothetical protein
VTKSALPGHLLFGRFRAQSGRISPIIFLMTAKCKDRARSTGHVFGDARGTSASKTYSSCRLDGARLYSLHTQYDPWRTSALAWRTGGNDNGLLGALQPVDLLFELGDPLLALRQGARRIRDPIYLGHEPLNQNHRLKKGHEGANDKARRATDAARARRRGDRMM